VQGISQALLRNYRARQWARLSAALICARVNGRTAGFGCLGQQFQDVGEARSSSVSNAAGKNSFRLERSRSTWRARLQISIWCIRVRTFTAPACLLSPATMRS
jgi:hypothetical protein